MLEFLFSIQFLDADFVHVADLQPSGVVDLSSSDMIDASILQSQLYQS